MKRGALLLGVIALILAGIAFVRAPHTPSDRSPDREALVEALQPKVEADLGPPIALIVETISVAGDWAFAVVQPQRPDGHPIDISQTPLALSRPMKSIDGLRTEAVFRKSGGAWQVSEYAIGATDVWYKSYCGKAPHGLLRVCGIPGGKR